MTPRIPPLPAAEQTDEQKEVLEGVGTGPDGQVLNIFATLVRHPSLMRAWGRFGGRLLRRGRLTDRDREILILRTALRCRAHYEWGQHVRIAKAAGFTDEDIERLSDAADTEGWSELERALIRAADELHDDCVISDATWATLAASYDEQQLIEVAMVVGQYHLVAFTLNSLGVEAEPGLPSFPA